MRRIRFLWSGCSHYEVGDSMGPTRVIRNASLGAQAPFLRWRGIVVCSPLEAHGQRIPQVAIRRTSEPEFHSAERIGRSNATQLADRVNAHGMEPAGTDLADIAKRGQVFTAVALGPHRLGDGMVVEYCVQVADRVRSRDLSPGSEPGRADQSFGTGTSLTGVTVAVHRVNPGHRNLWTAFTSSASTM